MASKPQDRDTFFRLDRALESYQKIGKAIEANKIRVEVEKNRVPLLKRQEKGQIVDLNAIDDVKKQLRQAFELDQN